MFSLKKRSEGFTIVELLIVIVIIGILATLVIVVFTGVTQKARDSKRQTNIAAVDSHLEAYYAQNGAYPTLAAMQSSSWVSDNMKGLDPTALQDPKGGTPATGTTGIASADSATAFGYDTSAGTCTGTATTDTCTAFKITADLENGTNQKFSKSSNT